MTDKKAEQEKDSVVKKLLSSNLTWSVVALIVLIIICTISDHQFLSLSWNKNTGGLSGPLITMLQESARYLMIATGMTLVISTAGIDLSVGSVMAVAGAAAMQLLSAGVNVWMVILLSLLIGLAIGCINGALVSILGLQPFITTLIMMLAGRGLAKVITSGQNTDASSVAGGAPLKWMANGFILGIPIGHRGARRPAVPQDRHGHDDRIRGHQSGSLPHDRHQAEEDPLPRVRGLRRAGSCCRSVRHCVRDANRRGQDRPGSRNVRHPRSRDRWNLAGKFSLAGSALGAVIIAMIRKTIITLGIDSAATPAFFAAVVIVICVMQAPKIHNLSAEMKRKRTLKAQTKVVAA